MSSPSLPSSFTPRLASDVLPPIVWHLILSSDHLDNTELWTTCRQVCSLFREIVDYDFKRRVLQRETTIEIDLDWDYLDQENLETKTFFGFQMDFERFEGKEEVYAVFSRAVNDRVAEDDVVEEDEEELDGAGSADSETQEEPAEIQTTSITKEEPADKQSNEQESEVAAQKSRKVYARMEREKLEEKISIYTPSDVVGAKAMDTRFDLPPWTIEIGGLVNDTELPGWTFDYEKCELRFKWMDAFECFFRESHGMREEAQRLITSPEFRFREMELRAKYPVATSDDLELQMQRAMGFYQMVTREETKARKTIRRHRMKKFWSQHRELDPDKDSYKVEDLMDVDLVSEMLALKKMRQMEMDSMWVEE